MYLEFYNIVKHNVFDSVLTPLCLIVKNMNDNIDNMNNKSKKKHGEILRIYYRELSGNR